MALVNATGTRYHDATNHSFLSVQLDPNYVDASTQPESFKHYPKFFRRFPLSTEDPFHRFLQLTSAITFQQRYREEVYARRVHPSAGALYPTELYVQIRGIPGWLDGIYHLEADRSTLTLIYELIDDGLEGYFADNRKVKGCIFLISCVYFRSSWKYKNRSLRYCLLDSGHHLGAIAASAYGHHRPTQVCFEFDRLALNADMGFDPQEFVTAALISGERQDRTARRLRSPSFGSGESAIPFVCGTDYFERNSFIEAGYRDTLTPSSPSQPLRHPQFEVEPDRWLNAIWQRRSARRLHANPISYDAFEFIWSALTQPIPSEQGEPLDIYAVIHRVAGIEPGIYRGMDCIQPGEFWDKTGYLCVNQAIARDSAVTFFFVSAYQNYQTALHYAGFLGHRVYLAATYEGLGCSGIGAFYDDETRAFLSTSASVLYAIAIGHPSSHL